MRFSTDATFASTNRHTSVEEQDGIAVLTVLTLIAAIPFVGRLIIFSGYVSIKLVFIAHSIVTKMPDGLGLAYPQHTATTLTPLGVGPCRPP